MRRNNKEPVYYIGVAARLLDTHPQTLRMYERFGLIEPKRHGHVRLFSDEDIERIRRIQHLTQDLGVNLAGVEVVFKLLGEMDRLRQDMSREMDQMRDQMVRQMQDALRHFGIDMDHLRPLNGDPEMIHSMMGSEEDEGEEEESEPRSGSARKTENKSVKIPVKEVKE